MEYFTKEEMIRCYRERKQDRCSECRLQQAVKRMPDGIDENMEALVDNVLDPCRHAYGKSIGVNSGFRCPLHNSRVGGASQSQHIAGEAADITGGSPEENLKIARIIARHGRFDKMILYVDREGSLEPRFIHVSHKRLGGNRHRILKKVNGDQQYTPVLIANLIRDLKEIPGQAWNEGTAEKGGAS